MLKGDPSVFDRDERNGSLPYVQCVLQKENFETMLALRIIAGKLRIPVKRLGFAGGR